MRTVRLAKRLSRKVLYELRYLMWHILCVFKNRVTIHTKQGKFQLYAKASDPIGKYLYAGREYELDYLLSVTRHLRIEGKLKEKGFGTFLDIGANNGVITVAALVTSGFNQAVAIEPDPQNYALLQHNVDLNGFKDGVVCLNLAVSNKKGTLPLKLSQTNFGDHRVGIQKPFTDNIDGSIRADQSTISVDGDTIDNIVSDLPSCFREDIVLAWIDVQGHESFVFEGGNDLFSKGVPVVAEIFPRLIYQSGVNIDQYLQIVGRYWTHYSVLRNNRFIAYPIEMIGYYFDELGSDGGNRNVLFCHNK